MNELKEKYIDMYAEEEKKRVIEELIKGLEYEYFKVNKTDFARLIRYNIHPYHMEKIAIAFLTAIADFEGYYPLLLNDIAKTFKHHKEL